MRKTVFYLLNMKNKSLPHTIKVDLEKNIPLPRPRQKYPYRDMNVGDSFFVENASMQNICNQNYRTGKKFNMSFIARAEGNGIRVWRVK